MFPGMSPASLHYLEIVLVKFGSCKLSLQISATLTKRCLPFLRHAKALSKIPVGEVSKNVNHEVLRERGCRIHACEFNVSNLSLWEKMSHDPLLVLLCEVRDGESNN